MNSTERLIAFKVSLIMSVRMLGLFMLFPVMSVYASDYDSSTPFLIGMAIGIYGLTQALLQIPFGYLSDRFGRKPILFIGLLIFLLGSVVAANATNIIFVVIGRALQGGGAISAVLMAFLADSTSEDNRAKANAFVGFQIGVAFMLSLIIGPIITSRVGLSGLFWVIGLLSIIAMLIMLSLQHSKPINYYRLSFGAFRETLGRELVTLDFSVFSLHLILASGFIVMPLLIMENQIVSMADNWQLYFPAVLLSFIGMIPLIIISEKFKKTKHILLLSIFLLIISQIIFFISDLNFSVFLITLTIFFVAFNSVEAILPSLLARTANPSKRGLAMGIFSTSQFLGTFIGGAIGGLIYDIYDLNSVFLFTIFVAIIWWFMVLFSPLKTKT
jgi:MFS family permease